MSLSGSEALLTKVIDKENCN